MQKIFIENRNGSVEHYFHFLLGFCVPLVDYYLTKPGQAQDCLVVRECGPLTRILQELPLPLKIIPKAELTQEPDEPPPVQLFGLDAPLYYSLDVFARFQTYIYGFAHANLRLKTGPRILLVEREKPEPFYLSTASEQKNSGTGRRAIRNHAELAATLQRRHPDSQNIQLAKLSLYEQAILFHDAELVIAQHGAALANLIFMRPGARVIEIGPGGRKARLFGRLAATMKLNHQLWEVDDKFPTINPDELWPLIDAIDTTGESA